MDPASSASWSSWVQVAPPRRAMTSPSVSNHSGSVSTSSPSMSNSTAASSVGPARFGTGARLSGPLDGEVTRLRVMDDDRVGGLLGVQLHLLGQLDADAPRLEQPGDLGPVGPVGAGGIADRVARALVLDAEEAVEVRRVLARDAQFSAHPRVPVLGEGLGELHRQAVQLQVLAVGVGLEELAGGPR